MRFCFHKWWYYYGGSYALRRRRVCVRCGSLQEFKPGYWGVGNWTKLSFFKLVPGFGPKYMKTYNEDDEKERKSVLAVATKSEKA